MPTILLQATVGAGKTEAALDYLSATLHDPEHPFARVWVLLATKRQEFAFRQRLIELQDNYSVYFNAEFFNFYELNARLLNLAGTPARRIMETARLGVLRQVLDELQQSHTLPFFGAILDKPGFRKSLTDLIYELKQSLIDPEVFAASAATQKDQEIAHIYRMYQRVLIDYDLVDREGEGWLALEALENQPRLVRHTDLLLVDGYDQFTPLQAALIARLSRQIPQVVVTLTQPDEQDPDRSQVIGRRFQQARDRLRAAHQDADAAWQEKLQPDRQPERHPDLNQLGRSIFSNNPPVPAGDGIQLIEVPDPREETAAVLRAVKRLLLDGVRPDDILIAVRDWERYHTHFVSYMRLYNLPLLLHYDEPLANNPVINLLMTILNLAGDDPYALSSFRRRDVLDILRSPYVEVPGFTMELVDLLDEISQHYLVIGGRQQWFDAIEYAQGDDFREDDENNIQPLHITTQQGSDLDCALRDFFDFVTMKPSAQVEAYALAIEQLIGPEIPNPEDDDDPYKSDFPLHIPACIQRNTDGAAEPFIVRDMAALQQFREILRGMIETEQFLRGVVGKASLTVSWSQFRDDLTAAVQSGYHARKNPSRTGRVLVTTAVDARGLPHQYLFIPGLSEGIFPAEVNEDPLYLDSERSQFQAKNIYLQMLSERTDDNGIFYELISLPRRRLILSRPYVREGKPWVESHLWRMVRRVFADVPVQRLPIGQVIPAAEVASVDEAVVTAAAKMSTVSPAEWDTDMRRLYAWLLDQPAAAAIWEQVQQGLQAESARLSRKPHDTYSGRLENPALIEQIQQKYGASYRWSASKLGIYGTCPFRFFAGAVLNLEQLKEPEEGLDARQSGSVIHKILQDTYHAIREEGLLIHADNQPEAVAILTDVAPAVLQSAPDVFRFRATALWEEEKRLILRRLENLVRKDFSPDSPLNQIGTGRRPRYIEYSFGKDDPLALTIDGARYWVRGFIDRVDVTEDGRLIVVDYKTGSTPINNQEIETGRNVQMLIYLEALAALESRTAYTVGGGMYWHIRGNKESGLLRFEEDMALRKTGLQHVRQHIASIRQGIFSEQPSKIDAGKCSAYCDFYQMCRLGMTNQYKTGGHDGREI